MNISSNFTEKANGAVLVEMTLPKDDRLLGGDPLTDWREAVQRGAAKLGIKVGIRDKDRGYMVAFHSHNDCELVMAEMQPIWENWLMQRLGAPAAAIYRDNPDDPVQAVQELVGDYGYDFSDFEDYIERVLVKVYDCTRMTEDQKEDLIARLRKEQQSQDFDGFER